MNDKINIELLEEFRNGEIDASEVLNYDGTPVSESELIQALEDFEKLTIDLKAVALKKRLEEIHESVNTGERTMVWRRLLVAAAVIALATFAFLFFRPSEPDFADYYTHFDQLITERGDEGTNEQKALAAYSLRDYNKALEIFQTIPRENLTADLSFYAGLSALASDKSALAIEFFERADEQNAVLYKQQIRWYSALAYWQSGHTDTAINLLQKINPAEFEYEKSQQLLVALRKK